MSTAVRVLTLAKWINGAPWRAGLLHSRDHHLLIWLTRGQGLAVLDGRRRGLGVHNALAIPAGSPFAFDPGKQGFGLVCILPMAGPAMMPDDPQHLRIRDSLLQTELTALFEAMQREQNAGRPFLDETLTANARLMSVWLRRAMIEYPEPSRRIPAAERLMRAFVALVERDYRTGRPMADYAALLGVTPTHLTRTARKLAGVTASDLLTQRVVHAARSLLERGDLRVAGVAACLGFNSAAYFSRFIQQHCGVSPSFLRRRRHRTDTARG